MMMMMMKKSSPESPDRLIPWPLRKL